MRYNVLLAFNALDKHLLASSTCQLVAVTGIELVGREAWRASQPFYLAVGIWKRKESK